MSLKGPRDPAPFAEFVAQHYAAPETELLERMWPRAAAAGVPMIMIAPDQARLIRILAEAVGARRALDVGTLFGYSAASLALGMGPQGRVTSLEVEPRHAQVARDNLAAEGLADRVEVVVGPALQAMEKMDDACFDMALVDADKGNYVNYLDELVRLVRPGGLVLFDNAFAFGRLLEPPGARDEDSANVEAIRRFHEAFQSDARVLPTTLVLGDGLAVGVVKTP